jgi:hypothetical protein
MGHKIRSKESACKSEAKYANLFHVGYNAFEVVVEFGQQYAGEPGEEEVLPSQMHTRVVTAPVYAREFQELLRSALEDYERKFTPIAQRGRDE